MTRIERARELRERSTDAERTLWGVLRSRQVSGHKFRRQHPIGPFVVDFVCLEQRLIIELDGNGHVEQITEDESRDRWLTARGYRVLRFSNRELFSDTEGVLLVVLEVLGETT